jgi:hypothetical protein
LKNSLKKAAPEEWWDYARELKEAVGFLSKNKSKEKIFYQTPNNAYSKLNFSRTFLFMFGVSIENLTKGILISEKPSFLENGKLSNEISSGHNLLDLSKKIKTLKFNELENNLFDLLGEVVPYWGKYPIPKKFNQLKTEKYITENLYENLNNLYEIRVTAL